MSRDKVHCLVAMLVGFAVSCTIMHAAVGQPSVVKRRPVNLAVQYQPARASQFTLMQPRQPIRTRTRTVVANAGPDTETGRRKMVAGAFGLALAASMRAAVAAEDQKLDKVFGKAYTEDSLPKAEDFTSYNKVQTKPGFVPKKPKEVTQAEPKPGSVEVQPLLVPAVVAFSALATAAVPALLSPGQTAKDAQDAKRSAIKKDNDNGFFR
eukprot:gnl/TRDRNA2_/TRDRNA2_201800_c0_seq1.p1 gnl/TRDRNA2_/TRDRNA2_201800_c0~~gnl/TRDRNA2_/TRDRNA2_201800_c0_seq1.p1  ORF type:complete len:209 (+),score=30.91 gnl/TRDRNA2_/TRDRNA2_201800_c0_seq1:127-753(+)